MVHAMCVWKLREENTHKHAWSTLSYMLPALLRVWLSVYINKLIKCFVRSESGWILVPKVASLHFTARGVSTHENRRHLYINISVRAQSTCECFIALKRTIKHRQLCWIRWFGFGLIVVFSSLSLSLSRNSQHGNPNHQFGVDIALPVHRETKWNSLLCHMWWLAIRSVCRIYLAFSRTFDDSLRLTPGGWFVGGVVDVSLLVSIEWNSKAIWKELISEIICI